MKIVINAVSAKMGGSVSYIINLLRHLSVMEGDFQFIVFLPPETAAKLEGISRNIEVITTRIGHAGMLKRMVWEQVALRRFLKNRCADVLFSTANFGMFRCPVRQILLVRNALYFSQIYCETFLPKHSLQFRIAFKMRRWLICQSAKAADTVMAPTQAMLDELRQFVDLPAAKCLVNHYGVAEPPEVVTTRSHATKDPPLVRLLYVSLYAEHKNLNTLLKALPLLNCGGTEQFVLETTVDPNWMNWAVTYEDDATLAKKIEVATWVEFVRCLNVKDTHELYEKGDIFVFPSLTESFGHPMAEAMLNGLPIVAADTPVNREICGAAAVYFNPLDAGDLAAKVRYLVRDPRLRSEMSMIGRGRSQFLFVWSQHAGLLIDKLRLPPALGSRTRKMTPFTNLIRFLGTGS